MDCSRASFSNSGPLEFSDTDRHMVSSTMESKFQQSDTDRLMGNSTVEPKKSKSLNDGSNKENKVRKRTTYSQEQLQELHAYFNQNAYLNTAQMEYLSRSLGMTKSQVKKWFQNMRMKRRKKNVSAQELQELKKCDPSVMNCSRTQGVAQPGVAQPGVAQPGVAQPGVAQPGVAQPGVAQPGVALPGVALPGVALPGVALPGVAQPGVALPGVAQPGVAQPGVAQPGVALPGVALPGVAQPDVALPGVAQPDVALPGVAQPDVALPDVALPVDIRFREVSSTNTTRTIEMDNQSWNYFLHLHKRQKTAEFSNASYHQPTDVSTYFNPYVEPHNFQSNDRMEQSWNMFSRDNLQQQQNRGNYLADLVYDHPEVN